MKIAGYQPLTLLDYPGVLASIVFTQGCFFRCAYCHNPELIPLHGIREITAREVLSELGKNRRVIEGVVITGGEPSIHPDLPEFIRKIKECGLLVKLDTNGMHPEMLRELATERMVDYVAMDIKNRWEYYDRVTRVTNPEIVAHCRASLAWLQSSDVSREFRTTVLPGVHSADDFHAMAGYLQPGERWFIQGIRYTKTLESLDDRSSEIDVRALVSDLKIEFPNLRIEMR